MTAVFPQKRVIANLFLSAGLAFFVSLPANAAPTPQQLVDAITAAKVLPASVAVRAQYNMGQVSLYMYRGSRVPDNDLKIDSVIVTKALRDRFGQDVKSVQFNFYDKDTRTGIRQCTVSQAHIDSFANKSINQQQLLEMLSIARMSAGGGAGGVGGGSAPAVSSADIVNFKISPGVNFTGRSDLRGELDKVARAGGNVAPLFARFKEEDEYIKTGQEELAANLHNQLVLAANAELNRVGQQRMQRQAEQENLKNQAVVNSNVLSYFPRVGYAFHRRCAIWARIKALHTAGQDVSIYVDYLKRQVDDRMRSGDFDGLRAGIIKLEQQLGLPVSYNWQ